MNTEAIFSQIESLIDELRRKSKKKIENEHINPVTWILLSVSGNEVLLCDGCFRDIKQQDVHINATNDSKKVLCEKCWEEEDNK